MIEEDQGGKVIEGLVKIWLKRLTVGSKNSGKRSVERAKFKLGKRGRTVGFMAESSQVWRLENTQELFYSEASLSAILFWDITGCFGTFNFIGNE